MAESDAQLKAADKNAKAPDAGIVHELLLSAGVSATEPPEITAFSGGASNLTYLLKYPDKEFVLRMPPWGHKSAGSHDMSREASILKAVGKEFSGVPDVIATGDASSPLGAPWFVMEKLDGIILRRNLPDGLSLDEAEARALCERFFEALVSLHEIKVEGTALEAFSRGDGYVERQILGWSGRWDKAATPDSPDFSVTVEWLKESMPSDVGQCLIHNDYRFDNVVLSNDGNLDIVGILDWELATVGDPLMELGSTLAYWIDATDGEELQGLRLQPSHLPGMMTRDEVVEWYLARTGRSVDSFRFYRVYGLFRVAVIAQQIYYRYYHKQTTNPRFGAFGLFTHILNDRCKRIVAGENL